MGSKKPSKRVVQFLFTSRHTVPASIPSSNYSPNLSRSCVTLPHILSRTPHSPSGPSARPSPPVSIKSLELNALHISQIQDMVHLNGNRSSCWHLSNLIGVVMQRFRRAYRFRCEAFQNQWAWSEAPQRRSPAPVASSPHRHKQ